MIKRRKGNDLKWLSERESESKTRQNMEFMCAMRKMTQCGKGKLAKCTREGESVSGDNKKNSGDYDWNLLNFGGFSSVPWMLHFPD